MSATDVNRLVTDAQALLAARRLPEAIDAFTAAYMAAVAVDPPAAALALFGLAQAQFASHRLPLAAQHAATALQLLTTLGLPEARRAADLIGQIDHYSYLS